MINILHVYLKNPCDDATSLCQAEVSFLAYSLLNTCFKL